MAWRTDCRVVIEASAQALGFVLLPRAMSWPEVVDAIAAMAALDRAMASYAADDSKRFRPVSR